jgi:sterol desaturase/sphingolipid hydroxylase (fatty acid hydroxylase superfamily)
MHLFLCAQLMTWYGFSSSVLFVICTFFHAQLSMTLACYLPFQDIWFYAYHRTGHYLMETYDVPSVTTLHLRHHDARARPEWLAFIVNYLPFEALGVLVFVYCSSTDYRVVASTCILLSTMVHLCIHSALHGRRRNSPTMSRLWQYHAQHHKGTSNRCAFAGFSPLGDILFGTMPPTNDWFFVRG